MKPFQQLTKRGKARRLRPLVVNALDQYTLAVADIWLVGVHTNTLFRVRAAGGRSYIIRVCEPGWRTETDLRSEIMWLQDLSRYPDIGAPEPHPARNGDFYVHASAQGVPEPRRCVVLSWIKGTPLEGRLTEDNLFKMGALFARLHETATHFSPPEGFTRRKMNRVLARDEEDVLFRPSCENAFTARTRDILQRTQEKVDTAFQQLYDLDDPAELRVIHNDLWHGNIKVFHGRLHPLDFEDTIWGYPVQDIAMALQDLMVDVERDAYEPLQSAFRDGYESLASWPESHEGQIDTFRAGRLLWVANYVARFEDQYLREHVDWLAGQFERFLDSGFLRKA